MLLAVENGDIIRVSPTELKVQDLVVTEGTTIQYPMWLVIGNLRFWEDRENRRHLVHRPTDGQIFIHHARA